MIILPRIHCYQCSMCTRHSSHHRSDNGFIAQEVFITFTVYNTISLFHHSKSGWHVFISNTSVSMSRCILSPSLDKGLIVGFIVSKITIFVIDIYSMVLFIDDTIVVVTFLFFEFFLVHSKHLFVGNADGSEFNTTQCWIVREKITEVSSFYRFFEFTT